MVDLLRWSSGSTVIPFFASSSGALSERRAGALPDVVILGESSPSSKIEPEPRLPRAGAKFLFLTLGRFFFARGSFSDIDSAEYETPSDCALPLRLDWIRREGFEKNVRRGTRDNRPRAVGRNTQTLAGFCIGEVFFFSLLRTGI